MINQTLNGLSDDDHKMKYFKYLISKGITIVSDIFERMDMDRKIEESLRKLQAMDGLTEEEYYAKKSALMRKMTQKATAFLYEKEPEKMGTSLRELAAKKEHEDMIRRARSSKALVDLDIALPEDDDDSYGGDENHQNGSVLRKQSTMAMALNRKSSRMNVMSRKKSSMRGWKSSHSVTPKQSGRKVTGDYSESTPHDKDLLATGNTLNSEMSHGSLSDGSDEVDELMEL